MIRWLWVPALVAVIAAAGWARYQLAETQIRAAIYRDRLYDLSGEYETLRHTYNQAVRKTAVTELIVAGDTLTVTIRTIQGIDKKIPTPLDPSGEVYVDYAVVDGRVWIRRLFDARTPPEQGFVVDPMREHIDWDQAASTYGKAVYRSLSEGRWLVTVTGDGSLGLAKAPSTDAVPLSGPPKIKDYPQIEKEVAASIDRVAAEEVLRRVLWLPEAP